MRGIFASRARYRQPKPGDSINDGKRFRGSVMVARASAPGTGGKVYDRLRSQADRTGGACDGYVYLRVAIHGCAAIEYLFQRALLTMARPSPPPRF